MLHLLYPFFVHPLLRFRSPVTGAMQLQTMGAYHEVTAQLEDFYELLTVLLEYIDLVSTRIFPMYF